MFTSGRAGLWRVASLVRAQGLARRGPRLGGDVCFGVDADDERSDLAVGEALDGLAGACYVGVLKQHAQVAQALVLAACAA